MNILRKLLFLFLQVQLLTGGAAIAESAIRVNERGGDKSTILLEGSNWKAQLHEETDHILIASGPNQIQLAAGVRAKDEPATPSSGQILRREETGTVELAVKLPTPEGTAEIEFGFETDGSLRILPGKGMTSLTVTGEIEFGVLPGLYLEDIILDPDDYKEDQVVHVPSENLFWALLGDGSGILAFAWPEGEQLVRLIRVGDRFGRFEILLDEKPIYLKLLTAPGIWHKERLKLNYLEKDIELGWHRPFDAQWKTQLLVSKVPTTWIFKQESVRKWIPMLGFFRYPVWFDGPSTMLRTSKKIPPQGHCFIYPLDGHSETPLGFVWRTPLAKIVKERTKRVRIDKDHSDLEPNVGYVHCWGTSILQRTIYKNGLQARDRTFLREHIDYCVDYVNRIQTQSLEYYAFICDMRNELDNWAKQEPGSSKASAFIAQMQTELVKVEEMYHSRVERGGRQTPQEHMAYAAELGEKLKILIQDPGSESFPEAKFILDRFNALSAATDEDVPAGFGITIRHMFQKAGSACSDSPEAVEYAEEIRKRIWQRTKTRNYETTGL